MLGDTLRKEREKQKLSIKDIEQGTSIRTVYIDALEKGEYDKLPGEVYAKGFIKNYGNFLNLNGEELVRQFIMEISTVADEPSENPAVKDPNFNSSIAATNIGSKYQSKQPANENYNTESDSKKYLAAAVALIAILVGGIIYSFSGSGEEIAQVESQPVKVETPKVETTPKVEENVQTPAPEIQQPAVPPAPPVNGVNLQATFSGDCWTRVIVDGNVAYEGMLNAGETRDWKGDKSVNILLGNAGAVQIVMNGKSVGTIGGEGDVVERNFTL